jgi:hypothetical protein
MCSLIMKHSMLVKLKKFPLNLLGVKNSVGEKANWQMSLQVRRMISLGQDESSAHTKVTSTSERMSDYN